MNRRATGTIFCLISAMLYGAKYITAAIYSTGIRGWSRELFSSMLQYTGSSLVVLAIISLVVGVIYLVLGEVLDRKK